MNNSDIKANERKIILSIALVAFVFLIKLAGGIFSNSLALLSDSLHLITDGIALVISWIGLRASSKPANYEYTYGHYRHSILTALINNIFLICISLYIMYKAVLRYFNPIEVQSSAMMFFSIIGIIVNSIILINLGKDSNNMNVKSAFLHFIGDAIGDVAVLIGAVIIYFTGISGIDTFLSAILSILILRSAVKMSLECIKIFLEATPRSIDINKVKEGIQENDKVISVTDIHIWSLSREVIAMTAHICIRESDIKASEEIIHEIQHMLKEKYNISHSTLQLEHSRCSSCFHSKRDHKGKCNLCIDSCPEDNL